MYKYIYILFSCNSVCNLLSSLKKPALEAFRR